MKKIFTILTTVSLISSSVFAGNPDRRGEAGAYELMMKMVKNHFQIVLISLIYDQ